MDLPEEKKGEDAGPTPSEVFISSVGACMLLYGTSYLRTAGIDPSGVSMEIDWYFSEDGKRIGGIEVKLDLGGIDPRKREKALLAAMEKCTIHNTLHDPPDINIELVNRGEE
ncbi:MAG: hypothetical protein GF408_06165 [Candidatus Omnitrophica bacterium]|nr:hypothetical protein [Candidatus Omnitrophota bacterium]